MGKKEEIRVIMINRPTKEESEQKTKELCEFLEKHGIRHLKLNSSLFCGCENIYRFIKAAIIPNGVWRTRR